MASQPIILEVDKIRSTDGNTTVTVNEINQAQVNLVENDLGISRSDGSDTIYRFGEIPQAGLAITSDKMLITDIRKGHHLYWDGYRWRNSSIVFEEKVMKWEISGPDVARWGLADPKFDVMVYSEYDPAVHNVTIDLLEVKDNFDTNFHTLETGSSTNFIQSNIITSGVATDSARTDRVEWSYTFRATDSLGNVDYRTVYYIIDVIP